MTVPTYPLFVTETAMIKLGDVLQRHKGGLLDSYLQYQLRKINVDVNHAQIETYR